MTKQKKPIRSTAPIGDREMRELMHDAAAAIGPQHGIAAEKLLPPLSHSLDDIAAQVAAHWPPPSYPRERWAAVETHMMDARAPGRQKALGYAQPVSSGFVIVQGLAEIPGGGEGWKATLIPMSPGTAVTAHDLVHSKSGRIIRFDDKIEACSNLQPVVDADGVPFSGQMWKDLPPAAITSQWVPHLDRATGTPEVTWRGLKGRWTIFRTQPGYRAMHKGELVFDGAAKKGLLRPAREFQTARDARRFCEVEDQR